MEHKAETPATAIIRMLLHWATKGDRSGNPYCKQPIRTALEFLGRHDACGPMAVETEPRTDGFKLRKADVIHVLQEGGTIERRSSYLPFQLFGSNGILIENVHASSITAALKMPWIVTEARGCHHTWKADKAHRFNVGGA